MRYLPLTDADRRDMLAAIGARSVDALFRDVPEDAYHPRPLASLPPKAPEFAVERDLGRMAARIAVISASGTKRRPMRRLSASTNTGRAASSASIRTASAVSNAFWLGCGRPGRAPSTEPLCAARSSRSSCCAPRRASASSSRVLPLPVGPHTTRSASATKTDIPLRDAPQAVTVVPHQLITDQAMQSMADVVRYVPGVTMGQGEGHRDAPTIRGNATTADFFVDGIRDDAQYLRDLYNAERIEALKGSNAMIFGRGGGGGVINRVTKEAQWTPARGLVLEGGSFGHRRGAIDLGQGLGVGGTDDVLLGTSPAGAHLAVQVTDTESGLRLVATVDGVQDGEACWLVVHTKDGRRFTAGSWRANDGEVTLAGAAMVRAADVAGVSVVDHHREPLATAS